MTNDTTAQKLKHYNIKEQEYLQLGGRSNDILALANDLQARLKCAEDALEYTKRWGGGYPYFVRKDCVDVKEILNRVVEALAACDLTREWKPTT